MKKLLLLSMLVFVLNGCRYVNTTEQYVEAQESNELIIPAGADKPNSTSTLEIPSVENKKTISENANPAPPDMPIRIKQSEKGDVKIANEGGYPVLTVKRDIDKMWEAMNSLSLEDWSIIDANKNLCVTTLKYDDSAARGRENDGFFKKIFRRDQYYNDYSGSYILTCNQSDNITQVKFSKSDGSQARTYLADSIMANLYSKFEE